MPTMLPVRPNNTKPRSKPAPQRKGVRRGLEGVDIGALCVGLAATILAAFVYFSGGDNIGAALVLVLAAVVVLAMWRVSAQDEH